MVTARVLHLEILLLFASMLIPSALKFFRTVTLPTLARISCFPIFSYLKNAYKKRRRGLEVGNDPNGAKHSQVSLFQIEIWKKAQEKGWKNKT